MIFLDLLVEQTGFPIGYVVEKLPEAFTVVVFAGVGQFVKDDVVNKLIG